MITIYKLTAPNGKSYIGQTKNLHKRHNNYKNLRCSEQPKLFYSLQKYGWENFSKEVLEYTDEIFADEVERYYIKKFDCVKKGLNLQFGGQAGAKTNPEAIEKTRKALTGRKMSQEMKDKISRGTKGLKKSEETKKRMSIARTGVKVSDEAKKNMSIAQKGRIPWNKGLKGKSGQIPWNKGLKYKRKKLI